LKEWVVAVSLEKDIQRRNYFIFNKFDLYNANGIEMASKIYFNKKTSELTYRKQQCLLPCLKIHKKQSMRNPKEQKQEEMLFWIRC
jgi:penicillin-binding protein 1A